MNMIVSTGGVIQPCGRVKWHELGVLRQVWRSYQYAKARKKLPHVYDIDEPLVDWYATRHNITTQTDVHRTILSRTAQTQKIVVLGTLDPVLNIANMVATCQTLLNTGFWSAMAQCTCDENCSVLPI